MFYLKFFYSLICKEAGNEFHISGALLVRQNDFLCVLILDKTNFLDKG